MTSIAILVPTRGRPEQCRRMVESAHNTSSNTMRVYLGLTQDIDGIDQCVSSPATITYRLFPDGMPTVHKWNLLAQQAMKDPGVKLFMLAADDIIFETPCWDEALIKHYEGLENKIHVYHLRDSRDSAGTPHPIVTCEYIDAMGYMLPPIFLHWYVDTWTVAIAKSGGVFTHLDKFLLTHDKPSDRGQPDETHSRIRRMGFHERDSYVNQTCQHFLELEKQRLQKCMKK